MKCQVFRTSDANPTEWGSMDKCWAVSEAVELNTIEDIIALAKKMDPYYHSPIIIDDGPYRDGVLLVECYDDHHS